MFQNGLLCLKPRSILKPVKPRCVFSAGSKPKPYFFCTRLQFSPFTAALLVPLTSVSSHGVLRVSSSSSQPWLIVITADSTAERKTINKTFTLGRRPHKQDNAAGENGDRGRLAVSPETSCAEVRKGAEEPRSTLKERYTEMSLFSQEIQAGVSFESRGKHQHHNKLEVSFY